jgi:hypothetical protein
MNQQEVEGARKSAEILRNLKITAQARGEQEEAERKRLREERRASTVDHDSQCI